MKNVCANIPSILPFVNSMVVGAEAALEEAVACFPFGAKESSPESLNRFRKSLKLLVSESSRALEVLKCGSANRRHSNE